MMDIQKEWGLFVAHLRILGVVKIGRNASGVITNLTREGNCSLGYNDIELMRETWQAGAQSQQAKIDAITKQRDSFIKAHRIAMNDVCENKAKIAELQKLRSLDEMAINQLAQANQVWRTKCDELQKRIDDLTNTNESLVAYKNQLLDAIDGNEND